MQIVNLLRAVESQVFLDIYNILPGQKWENEIFKAIEVADKVCVFWCACSAKSEWIEKEWKLAYALKKKIIPIIFGDKDSLPEQLSSYQFLDFSGTCSWILSFAPLTNEYIAERLYTCLLS
jgi:hypothetical protein